MKKGPPLSNPLLAAGGSFSLSDSFGGTQPALLVPSSEPAATSVGNNPSADLASSFNLSSADMVLNPAIPPPCSRPSPSPTPPSLALSTSSTSSSLTSGSLGPPRPGVFLLPPSDGSSTTTAPAVPPSPLAPPMMSVPPAGNNSFLMPTSTRKTKYVAPPGINSTGAAPLTPFTGAPSSSMLPPPGPTTPVSSTSYLNPDLSGFSAAQGVASPFMAEISTPSAYSASAAAPSMNLSTFPSYAQDAPPQMDLTQSQSGADMVQDVAYHWFYRALKSDESSPDQWKPFTMIDSGAIEDKFTTNPEDQEPVPTDGGRYDVSIADRTKKAVYWPEEALPIRRCSWFFRSNLDGRWTPYAEDVSQNLESEYGSAMRSGQWNRRIEYSTQGEYVMLHSPSVMMHFPSSVGINGNLDDWGQVQPQDPQLKPRVVHRGLEGLPEIPDGETPHVDQLVFIVHGIGSVCDIKFRTITEVVDGYRELTADLSQKHFQSAHLTDRANRIEFLPVNWHNTLHGEDTGTDNRLKPITLKSIPKLRSFVNDTLLDILFYTSPVYCQTILNTVVSEINRMYTLFMARNDGFKGSVSLMGHSLGSLILFDLLSHQGGQSEPADAAPIVKPKFQDDLNLKQIFELLDISDFIGVFSDAGIDTEDFLTCSEDDLKEAGIPPGPRKKLIKYIEDRKSNAENKLSGLEEFQRSSVTSDVKYTVGPAGTGQPSVHYPMLSFQPAAFYALGSPIAMFLAVRGINSLGSNFEFPTCPRFFNIFHPYDPVAYRVESLINSDFSKLRPVVIPHHKGRKRMHLELKDTVTKLMTTDIKKTILDSVSATLSTVYNIATGTSSQPVEEPKVQEALEDTMNKQAEEEDEADATNPRFLDAMLNRGNRIDYVLQEAPFESFNEYLFALASHLCYWESEDTCLMILKDIYDQAGIFADDANALMLPPRHQQSPPLSMGTGSSGQFPPPPRPTEQSKTPILAPPPTPMGGSMKGPSMLQSPTPILAPPPTPMGGSMQGPPILQSATPILAPPPTPMGGTMQGPPTLQNKPSYSVPPSTIGGPPAAIPKTPSFSQTTPTIGVFATPSPVNAPSGPAPLMMAPPPTSTPIVPRPPGSLTSSGSYPRPVQQPSVTQSGGMDPTAPVMGSKPVGPPPIGGYFQPK